MVAVAASFFPSCYNLGEKTRCCMQKWEEENIKKEQLHLTKFMDDRVAWNPYCVLKDRIKGKKLDINVRDRLGGEGCT